MTAREEMEQLRVPPHAVEAEQAVLGGLLLSNAAFERVADVVGEADFYRADHRELWRTIARLVNGRKPADVLTVTEDLKGRGALQDAGGMSYLHQLASGTPSAANIRQYAQLVHEASQRRALIATCTAIIEEAYGRAGGTAAELIDRAQSAVVGLGAQQGAPDPRGIGQVLQRVMESLDTRQRGEDHRIPTGLVDLDRLLHGGLRSRRLYVLGGRPSSGKSALALQIGIHAALQAHPVMVASMEMADEENGERAIAAAAQVELERVITGDLRPEDWDRLGTAQGLLHEAPIFFDDAPAVSLNQLRSRARRLRRKHGIELLIVDYLQLMRVDGKGENRNQEVTELAEGLKALAKELDIAVLALSQMNRKCEERVNKRGVVADLRDSGGIDAAADVIAFVYRDEMYDEATPAKGVAEIIIRKARQAKTGTVYTAFRGEFTRFDNMPAGYRPPLPEMPIHRRPPSAPARRSFIETERDQ